MLATFTVYLYQKSGEQKQLCLRSYPRDASLLLAILPDLREAIGKRKPWKLYDTSPNVALWFNDEPIGPFGDTTLSYYYEAGGYVEFNANKKGDTTFYRYARLHYHKTPAIEFDATFAPRASSEELANINLKRRT